MMGTINCVYETPCGWCSKWDKKCDQKTPEQKQGKINSVYDTTTSKTNKTCQSESDHEWECVGMSTAGSNYICRKCYARKTVPYVEQQYISITGQN